MENKNLESKDKEMDILIANRIRDINNSKKDLIIALDPSFPKKIKNDETAELYSILEEQRKFHNNLILFLPKIKKHINNITDKTLVNAVYLLMCHILESWKLVFILAEKNFSFEMVVIFRNMSEATDLIKTFVLSDTEHKLLDKWFSGKNVMPVDTRKTLAKMLDKDSTAFNGVDMTNIDIEKMQGSVYKVLSLYPHNSYYSMLESVDIFTKDFNFNETSSIHFTKQNLRMGNTLMVNTIVTMKAIFLELKDKDSLDSLNILLGTQAKNIDEEKLADLRKRFPKEN